MVSLKTVLTLGGIGAAIILFKSMGGSAGIGSSIGGGFSSFANSLTGSIKINPVSLFGNNETTWVNPNPTTPQQRQDSLDKQNDPNLKHSTWEEVITEVKDNSTGESWSPFKFNEGAYGDPGDVYYVNPTRNPSFASQGLVTQGYQEPNYSVAGAGYSNDNFFGGGNTTPLSVSRTATSQEKSFLQSYGIGV